MPIRLSELKDRLIFLYNGKLYTKIAICRYERTNTYFCRALVIATRTNESMIGVLSPYEEELDSEVLVQLVF